MSSPTYPQTLSASWVALAGDREPARQLGENLMRRWSEPHRSYHRIDHLDAMLQRLEELDAGGDGSAALRWAAWYHDAVYWPQRDDNEERSAELAEQTLPGLGVASDIIAEVARLVRLTATHEPAVGDRAGAILCDADLAVLGLPSDGYRAYVLAVRTEYAAFDDERWKAGRRSVLASLLGHHPLFVTPEGRRRWELTARRNMIEELAGLT